MYVSKLLMIIEIYGALDKGCPKHRQYRAKIKPRIKDCEECLGLYALRLELNKLLKDTGVNDNG